MGWPALVALLLFFVGAAVLVMRSHDGTVAPRPDDRGAIVGRVEPSPEATPGDTWRHHAWAGDGGPSAPRPTGPRPADPRGQDRVYDPQRTAMMRAFGPEGDGGVALPFSPITRRARIVEHEGAVPGDPDAACEVRVLPARSGRYDCLARVMCGGEVLYPNPSQTAGYVTCALDDEGTPTGLRDRGHSAVDGDPRIELDLTGGTATVRDLGDGVEPYRAELRLEP
ncbi:MAG TPA: hypothetical protein RMH99_09050 [Sandaracinaceae bacterium LLY-WYZ-13_1]|nr:hypothetical protein [Sandaracinaceae bacterium LLY-WYZ-13_1]